LPGGGGTCLLRDRVLKQLSSFLIAAGESESFAKLLQRTYGTRVVQPRDANQGRVSFPGRLFRFVMMTLTVQGSRQKRLSQ
jgi:hypothetical protein